MMDRSLTSVSRPLTLLRAGALAGAVVGAALTAAKAAPVALVVGIGATRAARAEEPAGEGPTVVQAPGWRMMRCPAARRAAEEAFRELTPAARGVSMLYALPPVWEEAVAPFRVSVLLTDGIVDNRYVPSGRVLAVQSRLLRSRNRSGDDAVVFLSGMGSAAGLDSWVFDRLGGRFSVRRVLELWGAAEAGGRQVFLFQIHPPACDGGSSTLWISDPTSADRLRDWMERAVVQAARQGRFAPPGERLPGLSHAVASATPPRFERLAACLREGQAAGPSHRLYDLSEGIARREQAVSVNVDRRVEPVYRVDTVRKPGPLFTIIEEDVKTRIGSRTVIARETLEADLRAASLWPGASAAIAGAVAENVETAFDEVVKSGGVDYHTVFDASTGRLTISYRD